jgi:hypothetical protein
MGLTIMSREEMSGGPSRPGGASWSCWVSFAAHGEEVYTRIGQLFQKVEGWGVGGGCASTLNNQPSKYEGMDYG